MTCPKCRSNNVNVQAVTDYQLKSKHHSIIYWLSIGWMWFLFKWIVLTIPALIVKIFAPKRQKIKTTHSTLCVCQDCGHSWKA